MKKIEIILSDKVPFTDLEDVLEKHFNCFYSSKSRLTGTKTILLQEPIVNLAITNSKSLDYDSSISKDEEVTDIIRSNTTSGTKKY